MPSITRQADDGIPLDRRGFLWHTGSGFGALALAHMLGSETVHADDAPKHPPARPDLNGGVHHRATARRVVQLFMSGAASQCDTFDYKPRSDPAARPEVRSRRQGRAVPERARGRDASPWRGGSMAQCGQWVSDSLPHLAACVDDIAFLPAMVAKSNVHGPATFMQNTGFVLPGFPGMGAWVSYGLGSLTTNLPTFVVLPDSRGFAPNGPANWSAGFLPAAHQGTMVRPGARSPIFDLFPPEEAHMTSEAQSDGLALLNR